jgi:uncharacterized 2Fe-2S/4Fe-4S cluster protein (DUF4445 family)
LHASLRKRLGVAIHALVWGAGKAGRCRQVVETRFSVARMLADHDREYARVAGRRWATPSVRI